jgi:hypothetical protein
MNRTKTLLARGLALSLGATALVIAAWWRMHPSAQPAPAASPQAAAPAPSSLRDALWLALSPTQQRALAPLAAQWPALTDEARQRWMSVASRFEKMSPEAQARMQRRMERWSALTPAQRTEARLRYTQASTWSAQERRARWEQYQEGHVGTAPQHAAAPSRVIPPATVHVGTGATTVLMTQLRAREPVHPASPAAWQAPEATAGDEPLSLEPSSELPPSPQPETGDSPGSALATEPVAP